MAACSCLLLLGCTPATQARVDSFDFSTLPPVRPASAPLHTPRYPRTAGRPPPPRRRWPCSRDRHEPECPCDTLCRTERRSENRAIPSLLRVTPSAISEHLPELLGSSPIPFPRRLLR